MRREKAGLLDLPKRKAQTGSATACAGCTTKAMAMGETMTGDTGRAGIFVILLLTIGPLKAAIVHAKLTSKADVIQLMTSNFRDCGVIAAATAAQ